MIYFLPMLSPLTYTPSGLPAVLPYGDGRNGRRASSDDSQRQSSSDNSNDAAIRRAEASVEAQIRRVVAQAGPGANVSVRYDYTVGPNGEMQVTGGTVSTTTRMVRDAQGNERPAYSNTSTLQQNLQQKSQLQDLQPPKLALNPTELAQAFGLSDEEAAAVKELRQNDVGVRTHEAQHFRTAGGLARGIPEFEYHRGPDGVFYAVGGHVHVSTTATTDEAKASRDQATMARAAQAPGDGSAQDMGAAKSFNSGAAFLYMKTQAGPQEPFFNMAA